MGEPLQGPLPHMLHWPGGSSLLIGLCSNLDPAHVGGLSFPRCGNLAVSLGYFVDPGEVNGEAGRTETEETIKDPLNLP